MLHCESGLRDQIIWWSFVTLNVSVLLDTSYEIGKFKLKSILTCIVIAEIRLSLICLLRSKHLV